MGLTEESKDKNAKAANEIIRKVYDAIQIQYDKRHI